jgi:hypothetical protein
LANLYAAVIYHRILTLATVGTAVNYWGIFITLVPGDNQIKPFFSSSLTVWQDNKLECLFLESFMASLISADMTHY